MEMSMFMTVSTEELAVDPELETLCQEELRYALELGGAKNIRFVREENGSETRIKAIGDKE